MFNTERAAGIGLLTLSVAAFFVAADYPKWVGLFPRATIYILAILSLALIVQSFKTQARAVWANADGRAAFFTALGMAAYVVLVNRIGFVSSSILLLTGIGFFLGPRQNPIRRFFKAVGFAVGITGVLYALFAYVFLVPLP